MRNLKLSCKHRSVSDLSYVCCGRRKLLKQQNPALLRMLLGTATSVVTLQRSEGIRLKEEYHGFRCGRCCPQCHPPPWALRRAGSCQGCCAVCGLVWLSKADDLVR